MLSCPLSQEVARLEEAASTVQRHAAELISIIGQLEAQIGKLKEEYAGLIRETEAIRAELDTVGKKVERSVSLLSNLGSESTRWAQQAQSFADEMGTVVGDCLLASGFLSYVGVFDQQYRARLVRDWRLLLEQLGIKQREAVSSVDYLALPSQRLEWRNNALPPDELCVENAVMLTRFRRYPLVIDPSGQATAFLLNQLAARKVIKTSFLDSSFQKNLESALRFGCPIVVEDVENLDPILNPILNRETRKAGGRVLIRLGDQDIDFSPSFVIYLTTRDPSAQFTPDLCSRVTLVNFTVTRAGLRAQCLSTLLRQERPDVEARRADALREQGEFRVALRAKEAALLDCISRAQGNLLQNDTVVLELERLKADASAIAEKVAASEGVMADTVRASQDYQPTAQRAADLYFAVEQLSALHPIYQYSLAHFQTAFDAALQLGPATGDLALPAQRTAAIDDRLCALLHERAARSLLSQHRGALSLRIALSRLSGREQLPPASELDFLLAQHTPVVGAAAGAAGDGAWVPAWLGPRERAAALAAVQHCASLKDALASLKSVAELETLVPWTALLLCKAVWPARVEWASLRFADSVMGAGWATLPPLQAQRSLLDEVLPGTPVMLIGTQGHDPARLVDELAHQLNVQPLHRIAIGSAEGFVAADKALATCFKSGGWVLLRNVHLAPQWLQQLEKRLHSMGLPSKGSTFRLFLTADAHPSLPPALLRRARVLTFEQPPGLRAALLHALHQCPPSLEAQQPLERSRLHLLVCWLHSVLCERLRYVPLGWSKRSVALTQADLSVALSMVDVWVDRVARNKAKNVDPSKLPWAALHALLGSVVYGGRIDNPVDQRLLDASVRQVLNTAAYEEGAVLGGIVLPAPSARTRAQFLQWAAELPDGPTDPRVLGLPLGAEQLVQVRAGQTLLASVSTLLAGADLGNGGGGNSTGDAGSESNESEHHGTGGIGTRITPWLQRLEAVARPAAEGGEGPLARFWQREGRAASQLHKRIVSDLRALLDVAEGRAKSSNATRALLADLRLNRIPRNWRAYAVSQAALVGAFVDDLLRRLALAGAAHPSLGLLFSPSAYVTATRQAACVAGGWALEAVALEARVGGDSSTTGASAAEGWWRVEGCFVEGARWSGHYLESCEETSTSLPFLELRWRPAGQVSMQGVNVPVYLNVDRTDHLFSVWLPSQQDVSPATFYLSGLAIIASSV
jgi:dynein heavy chain 1